MYTNRLPAQLVPGIATRSATQGTHLRESDPTHTSRTSGFTWFRVFDLRGDDLTLELYSSRPRRLRRARARAALTVTWDRRVGILYQS